MPVKPEELMPNITTIGTLSALNFTDTSRITWGGGIYIQASTAGNGYNVIAPSASAIIGNWVGGTAITATSATGLSVTGTIVASGNITAFSDERLKTNWQDLPLDFVAQLAEVKVGVYDRIDTKATQVGVSAQSLKTVMPNAVITNEDDMMSVAYGNAALAACIMLAKEVQSLKAEIALLKAR